MPRRSANLQERKLRDTELSKKLSEIACRIAKEVHPEAIILFGSYAKEEQTNRSDIDLVIILDEDTKPLNPPVPIIVFDGLVIESICLGLKQVEMMLNAINPLILDIFADGVLLYSRNDTLIASLQGLFEENLSKYEIERIERGWRIHKGLARHQMEQ